MRNIEIDPVQKEQLQLTLKIEIKNKIKKEGGGE